jgi:hypothetical protein
MSHIPVNHPLRSFYRLLAGLAGLYILIFGIVGVTKTKGFPAFSQTQTAMSLGLRCNLGFAIISIIAGAIILVSALLGRNIDHFINIYGGIGFMLAGILLLGLLETNANFFAFTIWNVVASFLIGLTLFSAGLYGKTGTPQDAEAEEAYRHAMG